MAYSATVGSFKKSMTEQILMCDISYQSCTGDTAYHEIFRKNMYWNNVEAFDYGCNLGETGVNTITLKVEKNGTIVTEVPVNSANAWLSGRAIGIGAALQDYGLMTVAIKTNNAASTAWIRDYKLWARAV